MGLLNLHELMGAGGGGNPQRRRVARGGGYANTGRGSPPGWNLLRRRAAEALLRQGIPPQAIMSSLAGLGKSAGAALAASWQQVLSEYNRLRPDVERTLSKLDAARATLQNMAVQARSLASSAGDEAIDVSDRVADYASRVSSSVMEAKEAVVPFITEFERIKGQAASGSYSGPTITAEFLDPLRAARDLAAQALSEAAGYAEESANAIKQIKVLAVERQQQAAAESRQAEAERLAAEAEQRRRDLEEEKLRREQERLDAIAAAQQARDEAAAQRQQEYEQRQIELQQQREERAAAIEEQRAAREEAARQAAEEAEIRKQEAAVASQERQYALEQERIIREQETQLRKEEREAEMQRLIAMQELAAKGLSIPGAPTADYSAMFAPSMAYPGMYPAMPGMPTVPGIPGAGYPTMPGTQPGVMGPMYPGAVPAGYVPPGMAAPSAMPGVMPGYAAAPAPYAQSQGMQPEGQGAAPPGFQWAAFDPSAEMFGLGALKPTLNPQLQGGMIEEGYSIYGPDSNSNYQLVRPNGSVVGVFSEDRIYAGEIRDGSQIVFVPPQAARSPSQLPETIASELSKIIQAAARTTSDIVTEKERTKQAKAGAFFAPAAAGVPLATQPAQVPGYVWLLGAAGLGLVAFWAVGKKKGAEGKAA